MKSAMKQVGVMKLFAGLAMSMMLLLTGCGGGSSSSSFYDDGSSSGDTGGTSDSVATYINATASPNLVGTSTTTDITATIYDQNGATMSGVLVTFATDSANNGSFPVPVTTTGSNGEATLTYTSGDTGGVTETITVTSGSLTDTVQVGVQTVVPAIDTVTLSIDPPAPLIVAGTTGITVDVAVKDSDGSGVANQTVSLVIQGDGSFSGSSYTSITTDSQGLGSVAFTAPTLLDTGSATITAQVVSSSGTKSGTMDLSFVPDDADSIDQIWATPSSMGLQDTALIQARLRDQYGNLIEGQDVTFATDAAALTSTSPTFSDISTGYSAPTLTVKTGSDGIASVNYNSDAAAAGSDKIDASFTIGAVTTSNSVVIPLTAVSTSIGDIAVTSLRASITADGSDSTNVTATVTDTSGNPMEGQTVTFETSAGTLTSVTATTDSNGKAITTLQAGTSATTANIKATVGGLSNFVSVDFVPGPIFSGVITAVPSSLPADGTSTSVVTVALQDANGNAVADGTTVRLYQELTGITDAHIASNSATTSGGRASFTITAATSSGSDTLYVHELDTLTYTMNYGVGTTSGDPASIEVSSDKSQISVAGVGREETATVTIQVSDGTGAPIGNENYDNIRVSLVTKPNAGEYVSGTSNPLSPSPVNSIATGSIEIFTTSGQTTFGVQSGTLPGVVEILVEVIDDVGATVISAIVPQMVIASGPAHTIVLTAPNVNAIQNLDGGVYRRIGTAVVTDRYGNQVPDGTVVNLGVLDSVIAYDDDGATTAGVSTATDSGTGTGGASLFTTDTIIRNDVNRFIQPNDRILFKNAKAEDKTRFISSVDNDSQLTVQKNYINTATGLDYVVGASTIGAQILGVDHAGSGNEVPGYGTTVDGQVTFYVKYPANELTVHVGCNIEGMACTDGLYLNQTDCESAGKTWVAYRDERYTPNDSAEVYVVASVTEVTTESAVTVDKGQFCFASIADWEGGASPALMSGSGYVGLSLTDSSTAGGKIRLPFVPITGTVVIDNKTAGTCIDGSSTDKINCELDNPSPWTESGTCSDGISTDQVTCEAVPAVWTDTSSCSDGVSADQTTCETNNPRWVVNEFDIDTANLGCITDNPGELVAGVSSISSSLDISGSCTATVEVLGGDTVVSGDKATISWSNGATTVVEIP